MRKFLNVFCKATMMVILPGIAGAAGTYYNNSVYQRYGTNTNYNTAMTGRSYATRYGQQNTNTTTSTTRTTTRTVMRQNGNKNVVNAKKSGFVGNLGLSHEFAEWNFEMNTAGSKLHYDNVKWNILSGDLSYYFGDSTPMQLKVGARYGMQFGESPMVDDDISNGGYLVTTWTGENGNVIGYQTGHALSVGTSKSGDQMGFNASFGLTDYFSWGRAKITPSIGYRYLKYKLKTEQNYGSTIEVLESTDEHPYVTCVSGYMGELQCDPFLLFYTGSGITITGRVIDETTGAISDLIQMPDSSFGAISGVSTGGSYYYEQSGTSHEYETTWAGPYIALDAEYEINNKNFVTAGIEFGLPYYTSEGNQPYRYDWAHPKSVEDKGSLGDAIHLGMAAMWKTQVADAAMLTLGFTYDYYKVSGATAKTFLNSAYYTDLYNAYSAAYDATDDADEKAIYQEEMNTIAGYRSAGWALESSNEIESVYKSMGIRLGLEYKF